MDNNICTVHISDIQTKLCTPCLICGESVACDINDRVKICDKCKAVVMKMREITEE